MYSFFASFYTIGFAIMPIGYFAAKYGGGPDGTDEKARDAAVWTAIIIILTPVRIALFAFPSVYILPLREYCATNSMQLPIALK